MKNLDSCATRVFIDETSFQFPTFSRIIKVKISLEIWQGVQDFNKHVIKNQHCNWKQMGVVKVTTKKRGSNVISCRFASLNIALLYLIDLASCQCTIPTTSSCYEVVKYVCILAAPHPGNRHGRPHMRYNKP